MKAVLLQTMKNYHKLKHYDYSKRIVSQVEFTLSKFFHLYISNSVLNDDEFISYDDVHELHHKSNNTVQLCSLLLEWLPNCNSLDELIDLSIIVAKCSRVVQKWSIGNNLYK